PACTPASLTPGTAPMPPRCETRRISSSSNNCAVMKTCLLRIAEHHVDILERLPCGALPEIVYRANNANRISSNIDTNLGIVRAYGSGYTGHQVAMNHSHERTLRICAFVSGAYFIRIERATVDRVCVNEHAARE